MRWWKRKSLQSDLQREIRSHLELESEEEIGKGRPADEAAFAARRSFGNVTLVAEQVRDVWIWAWLERSKQDLVYALRSFARTPGFTFIVIATLALGIGATSAIFTIVNALLLHPLPYPNANRLVVVWEKSARNPKEPPMFNSYSDYEVWKARSRSFQNLAPATWAGGGKILSGDRPARDVLAMPVGIDFFPLLGATAAAGRLFQKDDLDRGCTVVLKYQFWMTAFAGQQSIRGKKIELNEKSCDIVGVTSPSFTFYPDAISMWTLITPASEIARDPENAHVGVFGLLRPGVSIAAAQDELSSLSMNQHRHDPKQAGLVPAVYPLGEQFSYLTEPNLRLSVVVLFAAVCLVLLIACVNVANLLLGRSLVRQKEFAVRASLGSGRLRLIRQLLTECLLLSFTGALGGILLAIGAVHCFRTASPIQMPPGSSVSVNLYVLVFAVSLTIATAILFGLIPAWKASQIDVIESLKAKGRTASLSPRTRKLGQLLVTAEVTLSLTLLTGATLLIQSVNRLSAEPLGFNTSSAFTMSIELPEWGYTNSQQRSNFIDNVLRRTALLPGVQAAAFASSLPLNNGRWRQEFLTIQGRPQPNPTVDALDVTDPFVTPAYFRAMGVPLVSGRLFEDRDRKESEPVAIVNEALAGKYFPNQNPIGAHIRIGISPKVSSWLTIVGVVANEKDRDFFNEMAWENIPAVFRPISQQPPLRGSLVVRTVMPSAALGIVIQKYIASLDSRVPVGEPETLDQRVEKLLAYPRFRAAVLSIFATLAVVLAGVGLYGVLSHLTAQRVQEFGVRMVLGARRQDVLLLVIRQGLLVTSAGIAAGLILAMIVAKQLSSLLYGVKSTDPWTLGGVSVALLLVSILATYAPARRAAKLDPLVALRHE